MLGMLLIPLKFFDSKTSLPVKSHVIIVELYLESMENPDEEIN